jgi:thiol-disulfide isomerase/thioredoxin
MRIAPAAPLLVLALASFACAQDGGAVDPAAKAFIDKSRAALKDLHDLSCTVDQQMSEGDKQPDTYTGDVLLKYERVANGAAMLKSYRVTRTNEHPATWVFDGDTAAKLDPAAKTFQHLDSHEAYPVADAMMTIPTWSMRDVLMTPTAKLTAAKFLPDAKDDGVTTKVVEYTVEVPQVMADEEKPANPPKMVLRQVRHIGADDLLVRRLESWVTYTGNDEAKPRHFLGVYTNLKPNTSPDAAAFTLKLPSEGGYKEVDADPTELGVPSNQQPKLKFAAGDKAPDFALKTPDGAEVTLASLKGRIVLLDFWATWCGPCKMAMPGIQKIHEKYKGKPVTVIGVDTWERGPADAPKKYMDKQGFTYGLLLKGDDLAKAYGISGIPTFVLIGTDGKILYTSVGFSDEAEAKVSELIDKALGGA